MGTRPQVRASRLLCMSTSCECGALLIGISILRDHTTTHMDGYTRPHVHHMRGHAYHRNSLRVGQDFLHIMRIFKGSSIPCHFHASSKFPSILTHDTAYPKTHTRHFANSRASPGNDANSQDLGFASEQQLLRCADTRKVCFHPNSFL